ncbi:hypothetical protein BGW39_000227 [Mortierella sp. 14UC]|nr:hypothetical protein BGW39_000227 [Mortierella sp. 14UC]
MSSILNVLRQAPTPTRHFTSLQIASSVKTGSNASSNAFNPEHHPIVLQQLVESLSPNSFLTSGTSAAVKESISGNVAAAAAVAGSQGSQAQTSKIAQ